jgi:hypothetical protein
VYAGCDFVRTACVTAQFEQLGEGSATPWHVSVVCSAGEGQPPQACAFGGSDRLDLTFRDGRRQLIGGAGIWNTGGRIDTRDIAAVVFAFHREAETFPGSPGDSYMPLIVVDH